MTNYADIPSIALVQHEISRYVFKKEKPEESDEQLTQIVTVLIEQCGFHDYDSQCVRLLQICLNDFYKDFLIRFKEHIESIGSPMTMQDAFTRTLDDVMSINLQELQNYMKK